MATTTYLSNPSVTVGAVDLTDQCTEARITVGFDQLEATAFGDTGHRYKSGLKTAEVMLTLYTSYGASEVEKTLYDELGQGDTTLVILPNAASPGAANPEYTITNAFLTSFEPISARVGELSSISVTFVGGVWDRQEV